MAMSIPIDEIERPKKGMSTIASRQRSLQSYLSLWYTCIALVGTDITMTINIDL